MNKIWKIGCLVAGLIVLLVSVGIVVKTYPPIGSNTDKKMNVAMSEAILPISLRATPYELPSGELEIGKPYHFIIELKTADIDIDMLSGNHMGTLLLIGDNVSIISDILWEGKVQKKI